MAVLHYAFRGEEVAVVLASVKDDKGKLGDNLRKIREAERKEHFRVL